jgi:multiple sugar transport system substrate-binding protein
MSARVRRGLLWGALLGLAGCAGGTGGGGGDKTKVVFWQFWPIEVVTPIVERFEREHPEYDVVVEQLTWQAGQEKIAAAVASGKVPDLVELGSTWFPAFAHQGALADWTDSASTIRDQYRLWEMCEVGGRTHGLPWLGGTRALYYNRQLFARAGLDSSHAPETWEELLAACRRIQALGGGVSGYGANAGERYVLFKKFMPYAWSNGGSILSPDGTRCSFDSPANVAALQFYLSLADAGRVDQQSQIDQAFKEGKIGATLSGGWLLAQIETDAPELRFGVGLVPRPSNGEHRSFAGGEILATFTSSAEKQGAWALARFLIRSENSLEIARAKKSVHPTAIAAADEGYFAAHPMEKLFLEQLALAVATPNHPEWGRMESAIETAVEEALHRRRTPEAAIRQAASEIQGVLAAPTASR